jgi:uncharacterized protein
MNFASLFRIVIVMTALVLGNAVVRAQDLGAVKARMEQRLGAVNALKDRGAAGENSRGYLEARGNTAGGDQQVISDENSDRRTVYAAIAAQTGADADLVGRQRAQQIASIAKRGHWIQDPSGEWRQKT